MATITTKAKHFHGAYHIGASDAASGVKITDCPYPDKRRADGGITFSIAWRNHWRKGWRDFRLGVVNQLPLPLIFGE